jgi:hypothetical protein
MPSGSRPGERRGGRGAGTPNKITRDVREMVLEALNRVGGAEYLAARAVDTPAAFMSLVGKVLPTQIQGGPGAPGSGAALHLVAARLISQQLLEERATAPSPQQEQRLLTIEGGLPTE